MPNTSEADIGATADFFSGDFSLTGFLKRCWKPHAAGGGVLPPLLAWRTDGVAFFWWNKGGGGVAVAVRDMVGRKGRAAKECARRYDYDSSDDRFLRSCLRLPWVGELQVACWKVDVR